MMGEVVKSLQDPPSRYGRIVSAASLGTVTAVVPVSKINVHPLGQRFKSSSSRRMLEAVMDQ